MYQLIGFPLELLGIFSAAYLAFAYVKEDGDFVGDVSKFAVRAVPRHKRSLAEVAAPYFP